jgi:SAM-dependent methyltransferase
LESYKEGAELFYDLFGEKNDVNFYVEQAKAAGGKALELGVGTARLAKYLARAGIETWGVEPSLYMLKAAKKNLAKEDNLTQSKMHLIHGDAEHFKLTERFGIIYFPSCSFDHILDPVKQKAALINIRNHIAPKGRFVFDLYINKESVSESNWFVQRKKLQDGSMIIRSGYQVSRRSIRIASLDMWYDHVKEGRVIERYYEGSDVYLHDVEGVRALLDETGYDVVEEYGDHDGKPYEEEDQLIVFVTYPKKTIT